jgi:hypothetical protein
MIPSNRRSKSVNYAPKMALFSLDVWSTAKMRFVKELTWLMTMLSNEGSCRLTRRDVCHCHRQNTIAFRNSAIHDYLNCIRSGVIFNLPFVVLSFFMSLDIPLYAEGSMFKMQSAVHRLHWLYFKFLRFLTADNFNFEINIYEWLAWKSGILRCHIHPSANSQIISKYDFLSNEQRRKLH